MINIKINTNIEKLYDKYEIFLNKPIGNGSYSTVFLGRILDKTIIEKFNLQSDTVAIKKIKLENLDSKSFRMINDEVEIMKKINSHQKSCPNIIKCYDIIEEYDFIYLILEYCEDGDLSKIIGKPIKENVVKYYFGQIINALYYLYENNIIHRDIKPKNILLKNNKKDLVICDFGFARIKTNFKRVHTICGSPLYMAPELLDEKSYTEIVDIWAIGMILYEMIYGQHPYEKCKDLNDLRDFSKKDIIIPPTNTRIIVSDNCIDLMKKMLNKEESKRINLSILFIHPWIEGTVNIDIKNISLKTPIQESDLENQDSDSDDESFKRSRRDSSSSDDNFFGLGELDNSTLANNKPKYRTISFRK